DKAFAVAEVIPGGTLEERFPGWPDVHARLKGLFTLVPKKEPGPRGEQDWAEMLGGLIAEMGSAGAAGDQNLFEQKFDTFRIVARDRFMDVDTELLNVSRHLAEVAAPLDNLLKGPANGGP